MEKVFDNITKSIRRSITILSPLANSNENTFPSCCCLMSYSNVGLCPMWNDGRHGRWRWGGWGWVSQLLSLLFLIFDCSDQSLTSSLFFSFLFLNSRCRSLLSFELCSMNMGNMMQMMQGMQVRLSVVFLLLFFTQVESSLLHFILLNALMFFLPPLSTN